MSEIQQFLPGFAPPEGIEGESASHTRWLRDLGEATESLAHMMRKPTDKRPFVYEVRFDLIPSKADGPVLVAKGFGDQGSVVAFHNAPGFLQLMRGFQGQLRAGKVNWYPDAYQSGAYEDRKKRYTEGEFYRV